MTATVPPAVCIAVPGRLATRTGGFGYLRQLIGGLRKRGVAVRAVEMAGRFPHPDRAARAAATRIADQPDDTPLVIDGLGLPAFDGLLDGLAARRPILALIHHPLADETGLTATEAGRLRARETIHLAAVHGVICTSPHTAARLANDYGVAIGRLACVPPGTDPAVPARTRRSGPIRMLCVASLTPRKGHRVLLQAVKHLPRASKWRLDLVGSDRLDPSAARRIRADQVALRLRRRVHVHGERPGLDLARMWRRADLHVLPSFHEGYGMAHAEALRHGLPPVAGRGGATEWTIPAGAGVLVPPGDRRALAGVLRRLITGPRLRRRLALRARIVGARLPTWPAAVTAFAAAVVRLSAAAAGPTDGALFEADWLVAREAADAVARDVAIADRFIAAMRASAGDTGPHMLDLGAGDGNGLRWLAPRIETAQRWTLVDHDADRLAGALVRTAAWAKAAWAETVAGRQLEPSPREPASGAGAMALRLHRPVAGRIDIGLQGLNLARDQDALPWAVVDGVTGSALLDLVSRGWLEALAERLVAHRLSAWFSLSVDGRDRWDPAHPDDCRIVAAFAADQRRDKGFGAALGPDAPSVAAEVLANAGMTVVTAASPWRLGPSDEAALAGLIRFHAAVAARRDPVLAATWASDRRQALADGRLRVEIGHRDLVAVPGAVSAPTATAMHINGEYT